MTAKIHSRHQQFSKTISWVLCFLVSVSFFATLAPIAGASNDPMPCCLGKTPGHCDSDIPAREDLPPTSEALCGLDNSEFHDDGITIVAEPSQKESHHSPSRNAETTSHAAESIALSQPCQMDCGACAASSTRQQRRERGILQPATHQNPSLTIHSGFENQPFFFSSNEDWEQTSPRGPPAVLN